MDSEDWAIEMVAMVAASVDLLVLLQVKKVVVVRGERN